jgi:uncharacterized protein involved in response to NO
MQITDLAKEEKIPAFFRLGFRPFFFSGALFSVIALILWSLFLNGTITFTPYGGSYFWHLHEMSFGFAVAIIAGFVLTAVQNWTGIPSIKGNKLALLVAIWLLGRLVMLLPDILPLWLNAVIDLSFLPLLAYFLGKPIIQIKQYRNLFFVPLFTLFTLINLTMHLSLAYPGNFNLVSSAYTIVLLITLLISIMAGRVTPMFTANGTGTQKVNPIFALEWACTLSLLVLILLIFLSAWFNLPKVLLGSLFILAASFQAVRWFRWKPWITLGVPLLWSLHGGVKFIWFGLLIIGLSYLSDDLPLASAWHILTIGGMGGLILAMISRVSLGHTGRPLQPPKAMPFAFAMIFVAMILRAFGPWLMPEQQLLFIDLSVIAWFVAYGLFVFIYGPMLAKPRADGRPG